ncbi:MAG TPA: metal-sulfur cluster assembly factor [Candidatus Nanoarchaeia archaeon]|nr:metal-sulfur cluster assembly factor [Candidatus Nanoarchaeia archaeon]
MHNKEQAIEILKKINDPELDLDIYTLGLIYELDVKDKAVKIKMTFTSPMCPFGPQLVSTVKSEFVKKGFNEPAVEITFNPPWQPSEDLRAMLGV